MNKFTLAMQFIALWEWGNKDDGAYTNIPSDPGGETKFGISKRAHPSLAIKNLTKVQAYQIYWDEYWHAMNCDNEEFPMACVLFDTAINMGDGEAAALHARTASAKGIIELRRQRYIQITQKEPAEQKFLNGWLNRLNDLGKFIDINRDQA